jgi:hypothetical protein
MSNGDAPEGVYTLDVLDEKGRPPFGKGSDDRAQAERARSGWLRYSVGGGASRDLSRQRSIKVRPVNVITLSQHKICVRIERT